MYTSICPMNCKLYLTVLYFCSTEFQMEKLHFFTFVTTIMYRKSKILGLFMTSIVTMQKTQKPFALKKGSSSKI